MAPQLAAQQHVGQEIPFLLIVPESTPHHGNGHVGGIRRHFFRQLQPDVPLLLRRVGRRIADNGDLRAGSGILYINRSFGQNGPFFIHQQELLQAGNRRGDAQDMVGFFDF